MVTVSQLLSSEQRELQEALRDFFSREISSEYLRTRLNGGRAHDPGLWGKFDELGLFPFFSGEGGAGAFIELALIALEDGRVLNPEHLSDALFAGPYLRNRAGLAALAPYVGGADRLCLAFDRTQAVRVDGGGAHGEVPYVQGCAASAALLLCCVGSPERLLLVPLGQSGVTLTDEESLDITVTSATVRLAGAACVELALPPGAIEVSRRYGALKAAELAGIAERVVQMTVEYVKLRKQFGVAVGGFQAVQHQLADMHVQAQAAKALALFAAWSMESSPDQAAFAARSAVTFACEAVPAAVERAIQLHGGIGFTWEYDLHLYLRRAKRIEALWGSGEKELDDLLALAAGA